MQGKEVVIFRSVLSGLWYWRLMNAAGREKARSSEGFEAKQQAESDALDAVGHDSVVSIREETETRQD